MPGSVEVILDKYAEVYDKWFITPAGNKVLELELNRRARFDVDCPPGKVDCRETGGNHQSI